MPTSTRVMRALIGALALYALALSGFAAGLRPPGTMPAEFAAICGHDADPGGSTPLPVDHDACCALCCVAAAAIAMPLPVALASAEPDRTAARIAWTPAPTAIAAARDASAFDARGPPLA